MGIIDNALAGASGQATGYNLTKSLRFRASASAYLNRTPASATNQKVWTWSGWVKRGILGAEQSLISCYVDGNNQARIAFDSSDRIDFYNQNAGVITSRFTTTAVFRDPSAWYHVVVSLNATLGTGGVYVNGVLQTLTTNTNTNANTFFNSTNAHNISRFGNATQYFDGYQAEVNWIDGQLLTPSSFGETDSITGVWKPKRFSGTYGTNGFYLPFTDVALTSGSNAGLGKDFSGNTNYWNTNNISVTSGVTYDSMTDVPTLTDASTANYPTLNPLVSNAYIAASNGNLTATSTTNNVALIPSTMAFPPGGKYYFELTCQTAIGANFYQSIGIWGVEQFSSYFTTSDTTYYSYGAIDGKKYNAGSSATYGSTWTNGDVVAAALDLVNGTLTFYKNGVSQGVAYTGLNTAISYYAATYCYTTQCSLNFGQRPFAYTPPTGFKALNTYNLPDSTIKAGNKNMDISLYTGNGSTQLVTNSGSFSPDLVWAKARSSALVHVLFDRVRGATNGLSTNNTNAEFTIDPAFASNGFTVNGDVNGNGTTYVGWQWKGGGTGVSNTAGSITSTVSANPSAGFSIVTYTAQASGTGTIGHGLGVAPSFIITKNRNGTVGWNVYHQSLTGTSYIILNSTNAAQTSSVIWNNTNPTSSVFSFGTGFAGSGDYVAYCWAEVAGFSKFGSYTGNGSADGTFVYLGFRPKFILFKRTDNTANWVLFDTARSTYNAVTKYLKPNDSAAEGDDGTGSGSWVVDFLSNGFKLRATAEATVNPNGGTIIYAAFAENPFKNSLAR